MRKRWKINWEFWGPALGISWMFGWLPIFFAIAATTTACDRDGCGLNSNAGGWQPYLVFIAAWFGVVVVPAAIVGLGWCAGAAWSNRPRRVTEPVTTDLRETI